MNFPSQTPLFYATNRNRYERQALIREIESFTNRRLIVYVSNFNHPQNIINRDDTVPFGELLHDIAQDSPIDVILHSPGGDPNATEQLVNMVLSKSTNIRVIVPQSAKSAATMFSLVADEIVMSDSSELGPIDPQIPMPTAIGNQYRPAKALLNGIEDIKNEVTANGNILNSAYLPMLQTIDPSLINYCQMAVSHSKALAEKWLQRVMCNGNPTLATSIADQLLDIVKYASHGAVINWQEAQRLGLNITYLPPNDRFWEAVWRLYCLYDVDIKMYQLIKIFEGAKASVVK